MKRFAQKVLGKTLRVFLLKYWLKETRAFRYRGLLFNIPSGVFHPGLYFSSKFFASYLSTLELNGRSLLDIGTGSGFLALVCARKGAKVTACDRSNEALESARNNAILNRLPITFIEPNLTESATQSFDFVISNPPYFPKDAATEEEMAWYCGKNHDFFEEFFSNLSKICHKETRVYMILSDRCNIDYIKSIATQNQFLLEIAKVKNLFIEKNYIFEIRKVM